MTGRKRAPSTFQRNALVPALVAAVVLFLAPVLVDRGWGPLPLFVASILAIIVGWFAFQARMWWWIPVFAAVAVLWNPVFPFPFRSVVWTAAQPVAGVVFLVAGSMIKIRRA